MATYGFKEFRRKWITLPQRLEQRMNKLLGQLAHEFVKDWVMGVRNELLGLAENADLTKEAKQSSKPLVDHGDLMKAIRPYRMFKHWFVGILKGAKTGEGDDLVNIAATLEYGTDEPIKPKKGKYLAIPVTRKASRAGSPLSYPGHLIFLNDPRTDGAVFIDFETEEVQYVLLTETTIKPRPAMRKSIQIFKPKAKSMIHAGLIEELRR